MYFMYNKLKFIHQKTQSVFFFKFIMIRLLSRHHPAANPSPPFPLCPAAGQRGRGGEGLAEAQLPHIFQDGVSPFAPGLTAGRGAAVPAPARTVSGSVSYCRGPARGEKQQTFYKCTQKCIISISPRARAKKGRR